VNYATANGTAIAGTDYTAASGTLTGLTATRDAKTFQVSILSRAGAQGARDFKVKLAGAVGASIGAPGRAL
jgi:hypothetical protein